MDSGFLVSETWISESNREGDFEGLFFIIIFLYGVIVFVYGRSCWRQLIRREMRAFLLEFLE